MYLKHIIACHLSLNLMTLHWQYINIAIVEPTWYTVYYINKLVEVIFNFKVYTNTVYVFQHWA